MIPIEMGVVLAAESGIATTVFEMENVNDDGLQQSLPLSQFLQITAPSSASEFSEFQYGIGDVEDGTQLEPNIQWPEDCDLQSLESVGSQFHAGNTYDTDERVDHTFGSNPSAAEFDADLNSAITEENGFSVYTDDLDSMAPLQQCNSSQSLSYHALTKIPFESSILSDIYHEHRGGLTYAAGVSNHGNRGPVIVVSDVDGRLSLPYKVNHNKYSASQSSGALKDLAEQAYDLSSTFFNLWKPMFTSAPYFQSCHSIFTQQTIFESGLQTLKNSYAGILPTSFREFLALIHIVHALHHAAQKHANSTLPDTFFEDLYTSGQMLSDPTQSRLFRDAFHRVWCPKSLSQRCGKDRYILSDSFLSPSAALRRELSSSCSVKASEFFDASTGYPTASTYQDRPIQSLHNVTEACSDFFIGGHSQIFLSG